MPIRTDVLIPGSDGDSYKFRGAQFINQRTKRTATKDMSMELESTVVRLGYTYGDSVFVDFMNMARVSGYVDPERTRASRAWIRDTASGFKRQKPIIRAELMGESNFIQKDSVRVGRPCMFIYDALHKKTLPYFDIFPVIIPIATGLKTEDGKPYFIGLNLHYLDLPLRAVLLDSLYVYVRNKKAVDINNKYNLSESTMMDISYQKLMKNFSKHRYFKPTIHKYLVSQVSSRIVEIAPSGWTMCFFLPVAKFNKGTQKQVWRDSEKKIKKDSGNAIP
jgi:hypothetical protein